MQTTTEQLFDDARTHSHWQDRPVPHETLRRLWDLARMGPTSANCSPARLVFVTSPSGKAKLVPCMAPGNQEKTRSAPVSMIVGMDLAFHERLPVLFPHTDARSWFEGKPALIESTAMRNASLQGGYLIVAARALGLDCGPMSGFDADRINAEFFAGTTVRVNFVCNLGHGDAAQLRPRAPRLGFDEACRIE